MKPPVPCNRTGIPQNCDIRISFKDYTAVYQSVSMEGLAVSNCSWRLDWSSLTWSDFSVRMFCEGSGIAGLRLECEVHTLVISKFIQICFSNCLNINNFRENCRLCSQVRDKSCPIGYVYMKVQFNILKPTGHVMHQQFNIQQLYVLPTLYLCVLYLSENKQRLVPLRA